jgi:hypothetical protein
MKTNEQIFSEISENGFITYQQISLLKNRSNKEQKDCINYDSFEGFKIDPLITKAERKDFCGLNHF